MLSRSFLYLATVIACAQADLDKRTDSTSCTAGSIVKHTYEDAPTRPFLPGIPSDLGDTLPINLITTYKCFDYTAIQKSARNLLDQDVAPGPSLPSPGGLAIYGLRSELLGGLSKPKVSLNRDAAARSFDLQSFYCACSDPTPQSDAVVAVPCKVTVIGWDADDKPVPGAVAICEYDPGSDIMHPKPLKFTGGLGSAFSKLSSITFETAALDAGGAVTGAAVSTGLDDLVFKLNG